MNMPRRKVLRGHKSNPHIIGSNFWRVDLSCGHTNQVACGRNGEMPKTSGCFQCKLAAESKIKITKRKGHGSGFTCPDCKHYNYLGVYWAAHMHIELVGKCENPKCKTKFVINGMKITKGQ